MFSETLSFQSSCNVIEVDWILTNHHPEPLETNQRAELTRILAGADRAIGGRE